MCRLYGFISNEPTKVDCSLVFAQNALMQQSRVDSVGRDHTDGWGIATYQDGWPSVEKKTTAAFSDRLFGITAERVYSTVLVAHVRAATVGVKSVANTHPFTAGHWTFAHNGTVTGFDRIRGQLERETNPELQQLRLGETDSEQYFLWLLSQLQQNRIFRLNDQPPETIVELLTDSVRTLASRCLDVDTEKIPRLNFILTDGLAMTACRWNHTLYMVEQHGLVDCEICGIPHVHHLETVNHRAVSIASEPVTHETWRELDNMSVVMVDRNYAVVGASHSV